MRHSVIVSASVVILSAAKDPVVAQSLESRVAAARGSVSFSYATRPNVCGTATGIEIGEDSSSGWSVRSRRSGIHIGTRRGAGYERCDVGPAHVLLQPSGNAVSDVRVTVAGRPHVGDADLGDVPPAEAARYLLGIAPRLSGRAADHAVMAAQIAEGVVLWQRLLEIARDDRASLAARKSSVFWLNQYDNAGARTGIDEILKDDRVPLAVRKDALFHVAQRQESSRILASVIAQAEAPLELRKDAVFHLAQQKADASREIAAVYDGSLPLSLKKDLVFHIAQRRDSTSLDKLIAIAKSDPNRELRKDALFHLAQSRHPRAMKALEDLVLP
jgi:hypothetical protein